MKTFTFGSDDGMKALIEKQADVFTNMHDENWSLTPNPSDFKTLVKSLRFVSDNHINLDGSPTDLSEAAADLLSSIAESLGIEFI